MTDELTVSVAEMLAAYNSVPCTWGRNHDHDEIDAAIAALEARPGCVVDLTWLDAMTDGEVELMFAHYPQIRQRLTAALAVAPKASDFGTDDPITLSDVSGVLCEIAEDFDGGEYVISEETRRVLIDFAHGCADHPLFVIVGHHFAQNPSAGATPQPDPAPSVAGADTAWESTTEGYARFVSHDRYLKFSQDARRWYKPYRCSQCADRARIVAEMEQKIATLDRQINDETFGYKRIAERFASRVEAAEQHAEALAGDAERFRRMTGLAQLNPVGGLDPAPFHTSGNFYEAWCRAIDSLTGPTTPEGAS